MHTHKRLEFDLCLDLCAKLHNFFLLYSVMQIGWLKPNSKLSHFAKVSIDYPKLVFINLIVKNIIFLHIFSEKFTYLMNSLQDDAV